MILKTTFSRVSIAQGKQGKLQNKFLLRKTQGIKKKSRELCMLMSF